MFHHLNPPHSPAHTSTSQPADVDNRPKKRVHSLPFHSLSPPATCACADLSHFTVYSRTLFVNNRTPSSWHYQSDPLTFLSFALSRCATNIVTNCALSRSRSARGTLFPLTNRIPLRRSVSRAHSSVRDRSRSRISSSVPRSVELSHYSNSRRASFFAQISTRVLTVARRSPV